MDKRISDFIKKFNVTDAEFADLVAFCPMLEVATFEEFENNCELLAKYGYPREDLDFLLLANPNIFVQSNADLERALEELKNSCENLEMVLKLNPTAI